MVLKLLSGLVQKLEIVHQDPVVDLRRGEYLEQTRSVCRIEKPFQGGLQAFKVCRPLIIDCMHFAQMARIQLMRRLKVIQCP